MRSFKTLAVGSVLILLFVALAQQQGRSQTSRPTSTSAPASGPADSLKEACDDFLAKPTVEGYGKVRALLVASSQYEPYSLDLDDLKDLATSKPQEALDKYKAMMPNFALSPRAHMYGSMAALRIKDRKAAELLTARHKTCLEAIQKSGDGTAGKPYVVLRVEDEYDLLRHLQLPAGTQGLIHKNGRHLDMIQVPGGKEVWFDVTDSFEALKKSFGKG